MKVKSKGTLIDGDFMINDDEVKELPRNYKSRPSIVNQIGNMLVVVSDDGDELKKREFKVPQDNKVSKVGEKVSGFRPDVYLDQNSRSTARILKETKFNKKQLVELQKCEKSNKNRVSVLRVLNKKLNEAEE